MVFGKSVAKLFLIALFGMATSAWAQQKIASVRIYTQPAGLQFSVDGQNFRGAVNLLWPQGSKHLIMWEKVQVELDTRTRYTSSEPCTTNLGAVNSPTCVITADPDLTYVTLKFEVEYALDLTYFVCLPGTGSASCLSPGTVYINGATNTQSARQYYPAGTNIKAEAYPNPGFVFTGWSVSPSVSNKSQAFILTFPLNAPAQIQPLFPPARPISMTVQSDPPGLKLLADRTNITTPVNLEWGWDSPHTLGALSPQMDNHGQMWVFDSWSDGGAATHTYNMTGGYTVTTVTARFVRATRASFVTVPFGLKLKIDGRENWTDYNFTWGIGTVHTVAAADQQYDAQKRKYQFQSWSNGGPAAQTVTVSDSEGMRLTASYETLGVIQLASSPAGLRIQVDGSSCATPCSIERAPGTAVRIVAPTTIGVDEGARLDFGGWSDKQPAERTLTVQADPKTITADYRLRYQLRATSEPAEGAGWRIQPDSPDGFFDAQSDVSVAVDAKAGFRFRNWDGDLSGSSKTALLNMSSPKSLRAVLDRVPYIPPLGIRNAAGVTPDNLVAAGSIVSIFGVNLAADQAVSPNGALSQALGDVTVRSGSRLLPLFFVSPGQINVQLPSDLSEGAQTVTVRWEGKPEVNGSFMVARNAPGLFNALTDGRAFGIVTHEDGSAVSVDSPARRGEIVTMLGTGFGPYGQRPLDGFPIPQSPTYQLIDPVSVVFGDTAVTPVSTGAATGRVGITALRVQINEDFPHSTTVELKARVNGRDSNTILLPVE